jgi:hypothetical protein
VQQAIAQLPGSAPFSSAGTTAEAVAAFLPRLQKAVAADDRKAVAALVRFPLRAWDGRRSVSIPDRRALGARYGAIFTADLRKVVADARVDTAFANWQGVMWESGRIWIAPDEAGTLRIITINAPSPPAP